MEDYRWKLAAVGAICSYTAMIFSFLDIHILVPLLFLGLSLLFSGLAVRGLIGPFFKEMVG